MVLIISVMSSVDAKPQRIDKLQKKYKTGYQYVQRNRKKVDYQKKLKARRIYKPKRFVCYN